MRSTDSAAAPEGADAVLQGLAQQISKVEACLLPVRLPDCERDPTAILR
jgi:hypothetical protein